MLNHTSGEVFLGARTFVEVGGGWLSSGTAFATPSPGVECYSRLDRAAESTGGASSSETRLVSQWVCPVAVIL